jgi:hypothetical protein
MVVTQARLRNFDAWSILVIALDVMIIWAPLVYGRVIGSRKA